MRKGKGEEDEERAREKGKQGEQERILRERPRKNS